MALIGGSVLALHLWLWSAVGGRPAEPPLRAALQVRLLDAVSTPAAQVIEIPAPQPLARLEPIRLAPPQKPRGPALVPVALIERSIDAPQAINTVNTVNTVTTDPTPAATPEVKAPEAPVYRTQLPPPMTLRYELRRSGLVGQGALTWRPTGKQYELRLEGRVAGLSVLTQESKGNLDAAGIAPDRFTDQRLRRGVQAANFQHDNKLISFSGNGNSFPLIAGAQDRLSWMLQLAGVVSAEPRHARPDGKVTLFVVGARGDADLWVFDFVTAEDVPTARGAVRALKFVREPRKPGDSRVEVWLDPARHHVPVHALFSDGESLELLLVDTEPA